MFRPPTPVVKNLLILNVGIAVVQMVMGIDLGETLGLHYIFSDQFLPFQFFTYMFLHSTDSLRHLLGNMLMLYIVGTMLEDYLGQKKFLLLYIATGLGAGVIYMIVNYLEASAVIQDVNAYISNPNPEDFNRLMLAHGDLYYSQVIDFIDQYVENPNVASFQAQSISFARQLSSFVGSFNMVGASGAVFGVLAAFGLFFPNRELRFFLIPVSVKVKYLVGAYIAYEMFSELQRAPNDTVAHWAHLGGAIIAWIIVMKWKKDGISSY